MIANGNITDILIDNVYSGVISLRILQFMIFLEKFNQMDTWASNIRSKYLKALIAAKGFAVGRP